VPAVREEFLIIQSDGPSNGPTYKIHAGTFENLMAANAFVEELAFKERKNEILSRRVSPREVWYRVMIGSFNKREEALKTISRLKEKGKLPLFKGPP
jgi:cell division protein FtsN